MGKCKALETALHNELLSSHGHLKKCLFQPSPSVQLLHLQPLCVCAASIYTDSICAASICALHCLLCVWEFCQSIYNWAIEMLDSSKTKTSRKRKSPKEATGASKEKSAGPQMHSRWFVDSPLQVDWEWFNHHQFNQQSQSPVRPTIQRRWN